METLFLKSITKQFFRWVWISEHIAIVSIEVVTIGLKQLLYISVYDLAELKTVYMQRGGWIVFSLDSEVHMMFKLNAVFWIELFDFPVK